MFLFASSFIDTEVSNSALVQWLERRNHNPNVVGSTPTLATWVAHFMVRKHQNRVCLCLCQRFTNHSSSENVSKIFDVFFIFFFVSKKKSIEDIRAFFVVSLC